MFSPNRKPPGSLPGGSGSIVGNLEVWSAPQTFFEVPPYRACVLVLLFSFSALGATHSPEQREVDQAHLLRSRKARLDLRVRPLSLNANSPFGLVAGARYEPLQISFEPPEQFVAGLRLVA